MNKEEFKRLSEQSPISIDRQIEILETAIKEIKYNPFEPYADNTVRGLCGIISENIYINIEYQTICETKKLWLSSMRARYFIPCFNKNSAEESNTNANTKYFYWWSRKANKGGLSNRIKFLEWLIERLKEAKE